MPRWRTLLSAGCATAALAGVAASVHGHWPDAAATAGDLLMRLKGFGPAGWVGVTAMQVTVAVSGVLPASVLGIAAGAVYGASLGFGLVATGTLIGAGIAFHLSRSLFRPVVARLMSQRPRLLDFDRRVGEDGWKLACLLRVSPVMPFMATSYMLGLSSISFRNYMIGCLAALPALFGYVLLGALIHAGAANWSGKESLLRTTLLAVGAVATLVMSVLIARMLRQFSPSQESPEES